MREQRESPRPSGYTYAIPCLASEFKCDDGEAVNAQNPELFEHLESKTPSLVLKRPHATEHLKLATNIDVTTFLARGA